MSFMNTQMQFSLPSNMPNFNVANLPNVTPISEAKPVEEETPEEAKKRTSEVVTDFAAKLKIKTEAIKEEVVPEEEEPQGVQEDTTDAVTETVEAEAQAAEEETETKAKAEAEEPEEEKAVEAKEEKAEVKEEKPKKTRKTAAKKTKKAEKKESAEAETVVPPADETTTTYVVDISKKPNYDEADEWMKSYYLDEKFIEKLNYFSEKITDIRIEGDMNAGTLNAVIGQIDCVNDEISVPYTNSVLSDEAFNNKDNGLVAKVRATAKGKNLREQKLEAIKLLQNCVIDGTPIDLDYMAVAASLRRQALEQQVTRLNAKRNLCITMSAGLKMQSRV